MEREVGCQVEIGHEAEQITCRIGDVDLYDELEEEIEAVMYRRGKCPHHDETDECGQLADLFHLSLNYGAKLGIVGE